MSDRRGGADSGSGSSGSAASGDPAANGDPLVTRPRSWAIAARISSMRLSSLRATVGPFRRPRRDSWPGPHPQARPRQIRQAGAVATATSGSIGAWTVCARTRVPAKYPTIAKATITASVPSV
jgi:hypothetical protein